MNKTPRTLAKFILSTIVPTVLMSSFNVGDANAAPGVLQNVPFAAITTSVQPNILFLLDDSGSMQWEYVLREGANSGIQNSFFDFTPDNDNERRDLCYGYNTLAYNPNFNYHPWKGLDAAGNPFADQIDLTRVRLDPFSTSTTWWISPDGFGTVNGVANLLNLDYNNTVLGYMPWVDVDEDGVYDDGECSGTYKEITDLSAEQQDNIANWFSYYRSRSWVAKNSLLSIIETSRARVGVAGLQGNTADGIRIKDVDDISLSDDTTEGDARRLAAIANKAALMRQVASSESSGITRLSATLLEAGEYFREEGSVPTAFFGTAVEYNAPGSSSTEQTISATSPILNEDNGGTCQANFAVLFTDGLAYGGNANAAFNADGGATADDYTSDFDGGTFADGFTGTIADAAMYHLERDLAPSLSDNTNIDDIRRAGEVINHQHMTTYTIGFGVNGTLTDNPLPTDTTFAWPQPVDNNATSIDDMRHAAWNGRGKFLESSDPQQLVTDINNVFLDINARTQSTTAASSVSSGFVQESSLVFQTQFDSTDWSGNMFTFRYDEDNIIDAANPIFDVQSVLSSRVLADNLLTATGNAAGYNNSRNIITKQIDLSDIATNSTTATTLKTGAGVAFDFSELSASQQLIFKGSRTSFPDWVGTDLDVFGTALVNFITGDSTHEYGINGELEEQGVFRDRQQRYLGAIVNSSPQFVSAPNERYPDTIEGSLYSAFKTAQSTRTPMVYVGANDGMLHAFDVSVDTDLNATPIIASNINSGKEVFGYVPALLTADLPQLAQPAYDFDSFVDATPTLRDVYVDADGGGAGITKAWRTYLVGALRNGGRGIYALDVTDPATTFDSASTTPAIANAKAAQIARFEYTHPDMGFTYSRPQMARMNDYPNGDPGEWVAIVGNGYNSVGDGKAKLFIIDLETGLPLVGAGPTGDGIIDTGEGSILNNLCTGSDCNGLSSPTLVDLNGDSKVDRIYAGDLYGNMWVFNVQSPTRAQWTVTKLFTATQTVCPAVGNCRQPITTRPEVSLHPSKRSTATSPNILVLFGTGQFIAEGDASISENQSFYNVWDTTGTSGTVTNNNLTKSDLESRSFGGTDDNFTVTGTAAAYDAAASSATRNFGWYIDLAANVSDGSTGAYDPFDRGRVSINPIISGSVVFFITSVPSGGEVCRAGEIPGFLTALDVVTGKTPAFEVFDDGDDNTIASSTIALSAGAVGLGLDTTNDGTQTRITNIDGTITQDQVSDAQDIPSGRKAWSILR
jgi:type IV pilus assembly protein PilY1